MSKKFNVGDKVNTPYNGKGVVVETANNGNECKVKLLAIDSCTWLSSSCLSKCWW